ncbi:MAG: DNA-directed RNA polymerase subunit L [Candidatus Burarchaeum sp.]|nr:DNA-directed RNA polymerase subunit L [Candidatus Burarchaeum sp.]MDO8339442.1 DNA-directed RNA polymerase subunit L [Candidatus Burarchaeum sp.]
MKLEFLVDEKNHVELILHGEDHSFANALREKILEEKGVEFVSVTREHPTAASPKLVLKTKGKPARELLTDAVKALQKDTKEFMSHMKKSA